MKKRIAYIDILRGIGILLMVMGHVGFGSRFSHYIHAFHMPLFFVVSGYFYSAKADLISLAKKRTKTLLIPYLVVGLASCLLSNLLNGSSTLLESLQALLIVDTNNIPYVGAIWFLAVLYLASILFYFVEKVNSNIIQLMIVIVVSTLGCISQSKLPFMLGSVMVAIGFMYVGKKLSQTKYRSYFLELNMIQILIGGIVLSVSIFINGYVSMRSGLYSNLFLFWVNAVGMCIILMNLCRVIDDWDCLKKINEVLKNLSENSIYYLCLNQIIITVFNYLNASFWHIPTLLFWVAELEGVLLVIYVVTYVIKNLFKAPQKRVHETLLISSI